MARWLLATGLAAVLAMAATIMPGRAETDLTTPQTEASLPADVLALSRALRMAEATEILSEEGKSSGRDMAADLPRGVDDPLWAQALTRIYDPVHMEAVFNTALAAALEQDSGATQEATKFFASDIGQEVLALELAARRALMDEAVETAAQRAYGLLALENPDRQALIDRFVKANDLVESNVMGALNANLAFLRGLADTGGSELAMDEAEMLSQVWSAESDTRAETVGWLFPFLTLAYQPLSDDKLQAYVDFSESPAGKRMNAAMFQAFDVLFEGISRDLGRAYALSLQGNDI